MARRTGASARTLALTKAQEAVALRDAERIKREKELEKVLADYFQAQAETQRIRDDAEAKVAPFEAVIREAVLKLDQLGETRAGIAALTGLPLLRVRDYFVESGPKAPAPGTSNICGTDSAGSPPNIADSASSHPAANR
ncbi:hypothetical protein ABH935_006226 [Catenulispora sp. GAS73]|uniref:hypothetical protein n=1 Tax=Catenulispora sp. GAS73 TaxID=3156269 RepID=UPI0035130650